MNHPESMFQLSGVHYKYSLGMMLRTQCLVRFGTAEAPEIYHLRTSRLPAVGRLKGGLGV